MGDQIRIDLEIFQVQIREACNILIFFFIQSDGYFVNYGILSIFLYF